MNYLEMKQTKLKCAKEAHLILAEQALEILKQKSALSVLQHRTLKRLRVLSIFSAEQMVCKLAKAVFLLLVQRWTVVLVCDYMMVSTLVFWL